MTLTIAQVTDTFSVLNGDPDGNFFCNGDPNDPDNDGQKAALVTYLNGIYTGLGMTPERVICEAQEESTDSNVLLELKKELKKESVSVASSEGVLESITLTTSIYIYSFCFVILWADAAAMCQFFTKAVCSSSHH